MMSEAEQIRQFDRAGNMPLAWAIAANSLLTASRFLKVHRDKYHPMQVKNGRPIPDEGMILFQELMLRGFGLECLMKGLWVKSGHKIAVNGRYVKVKGVANHNLVALAAAVGLHLDSKENDVLKRLSIIMTSSGRYPIPSYWDKKKIQRLHGGGEGIPEYWTLPTDDRICESIIRTIKKDLKLIKTRA